MQTVDITELIKAVIEVILAVASAILIPLIKAKWDTEKVTKLMKYVDIGVLAAEQLYTTEQWEEKKFYVQHYLQDKGYDIDSLEIDTAIESAVKRIKTELKDGDE